MFTIIFYFFLFLVIRSIYRFLTKTEGQTRENYPPAHQTGNYKPYQHQNTPKEPERKPYDNANIVDAQFTDLPDDKGK